jgi:PIN domain nuclease of toxin-antitoxin system
MMGGRAVADTHALLFHAKGSGKLGSRAAAHLDACERREGLTYVPVAVVWEVAFLLRAGRINLRRTPRQFFADLFSNPSYQPYDISVEQAFIAADIGLGRDPFDALITAAAVDLDLPLMTRDEEIRSSRRVRTLW